MRTLTFLPTRENIVIARILGAAMGSEVEFETSTDSHRFPRIRNLHGFALTTYVLEKAWACINKFEVLAFVE